MRKTAVVHHHPIAVLFAFLVSALLLFNQILDKPGVGLAAPATELLWGVAQRCSYEIDNAKRSIDGPRRGFDGKTASCELKRESGEAAWVYTDFQKTHMILIQNVKLEISLALSDWEGGDMAVLQLSTSNGTNWNTLQVFNTQNLPAEALSRMSYDITGMVPSPDDVNRVQIRITNNVDGQLGGGFTIHLDEASLQILGDVLPTPTSTIHVPASGASPQPTEILEPTRTPRPTRTPEATPTPRQHHTATAEPTRGQGSFLPTPTSVETLSPTLATSIFTGTPTITPLPTMTIPVIPTSTVSTTGVITHTTLVSPTPYSPPSVPVLAGDENLLAIAQQCTYPVENPGFAVDLGFNDLASTCSGEFAQSQGQLHYTAFQFTTFTHIDRVALYLRFSIAGWSDDAINLEIFNGTQWIILDQFASGQSIPPGVLTTLSYDVSKYLNSPEAVNQASLRLVGQNALGTVDQISISFDEAQLSVDGGYPAEITLPALPLPQKGLSLLRVVAPVAGDPHNDFSMLADSCAACHRGHSASGIVARAAWPEETVCFTCHASNGPGTSVLPAFSKYTNSATGFYKHDVSLANGVHRIGQSNSADFSGANRHIECEDCHNPHTASRGPSASPFLQPEMAGSSGVDPTWTTNGAPAFFTWMASAEREYQVCFKCHSSFTNLPNYLPDGWNGSSIVADGLRKLTSANSAQVRDSRDLAKEFNPYQASFHPVVTQGRNQNIPPGSFISGWSQTSMTYCSDCHSNPTPATEGYGPHGSPRLHLLLGGSNFSTVMVNGAPTVAASQVCFLCHDYQLYVNGQNSSNTNFPYHEKHLHNDWGVTCYTCHDSHGSEQLHLINFDASVVTFLNGRNSQTAWYYDQASGRAGCYLSCHGKSHNPLTYAP